MRNLLGTCSFLLLSATLAGQSPMGGSALSLAMPVSLDCPVGVSADRLPGGEVLRVTPGEPASGIAMHVVFRPGPVSDAGFSAAAIVGAKVTLHGMTGRGVVPAGNRHSQDQTEGFTLAPTAEAGPLYRATVRVSKLTSVTYLDVNELTYSDGTRWRASAKSVCRVAPNGYMLVAGVQ